MVNVKPCGACLKCCGSAMVNVKIPQQYYGTHPKRHDNIMVHVQNTMVKP